MTDQPKPIQFKPEQGKTTYQIAVDLAGHYAGYRYEVVQINSSADLDVWSIGGNGWPALVLLFDKKTGACRISGENARVVRALVELYEALHGDFT